MSDERVHCQRGADCDVELRSTSHAERTIYTCVECLFTRSSREFFSANEALNHLVTHDNAWHKVPQHVLDMLLETENA